MKNSFHACLTSDVVIKTNGLNFLGCCRRERIEEVRNDEKLRLMTCSDRFYSSDCPLSRGKSAPFLTISSHFF